MFAVNTERDASPSHQQINKTAIIVPFRDLEYNKDIDVYTSQSRTKQLHEFIKYMDAYLGDDCIYKIFVVEQTDDGHKFNRGQLLNIGFVLAEKENFTNFIFHDVDLLPSQELRKYYVETPKKKPVHIASVWDRYNFPKYFGGIVAVNKTMFTKINGFPNNFWGWGGEDDELYKRVVKFYKIEKAKEGRIIDLENMTIGEKMDYLRENVLKFMLKNEALALHEKTWRKNGLNSLKYKIVEKSVCGTNCERILADLDKTGGVRIITSITTVPAHVLGADISSNGVVPHDPFISNNQLQPHFDPTPQPHPPPIKNSSPIIDERKIISSYADAFSIASKYIPEPHSSIDGDSWLSNLEENIASQYLHVPENVNASIWEMSIPALENTLSYILEYLNHSCYMLCVHKGKGHIYKLENKKTADVYKPVIQSAIRHVDSNPTITERQKKFIKDRLKSGNELRFMQCIMKEHNPEKETYTQEYDDFIQGLRLPDGVFILNLTDAVILRKDGTHPFPMVVGNGVAVPQKYGAGAKFIPIFSISGQKGYYDIPIPNYDDVMYVLNKTNINMAEFQTEWQEKKNMAVFRGSPTGCGYTTETNQRLKLTTIASDLLDVGISGKGATINTYSIRFDPVHGIGMLNTAIKPTTQFLPMAKQSEYKYIIHIDGNVNAYRLLTTMATGSLILRVDSPYTSWVDHYIKQGVHYVAVREDMSDLLNKIKECVKNDIKCQKIAENGMNVAKYLLRKNILRSIFQNIVYRVVHKNDGSPAIPTNATSPIGKIENNSQNSYVSNEKKHTPAKMETRASMSSPSPSSTATTGQQSPSLYSVPKDTNKCPKGSRKIIVDGIAKCKKNKTAKIRDTPILTTDTKATPKPAKIRDTSILTTDKKATPKTANSSVFVEGSVDKRERAKTSALLDLMEQSKNSSRQTRKVVSVDATPVKNRTTRKLAHVAEISSVAPIAEAQSRASSSSSVTPLYANSIIHSIPERLKEEKRKNRVEGTENFPWLIHSHDLAKLVSRIETEIPEKMVIDDHRVTFKLLDDTPSLATRAIQEEEILKTHLKHRTQGGEILNMPSFWDVWRSNPELSKEIVRNKDPAEAVWKLAKKFNYKLATTFMPSYAKALYDSFHAKNVLDPCTGWGDRMLGALCSPSVAKYVGFDPNKNLRAGYAQIAKLKGVNVDVTRLDDDHLYFSNGFEMHSLPFEQGAKQLQSATFDFAFTSPPFFDYEMYNPDNPEYRDWIKEFYVPLFTETCRLLKDGHYFGIHIGDTTAGKISDFLYKHVHRVSGFILDFKIGLMGVQSGKNRTVYMYRKVANSAPVPRDLLPFAPPVYKQTADEMPTSPNVEKILNPPLLIRAIEHGGKEFHLVQDAQCIGGTKQRLLAYLLAHIQQKEIVYAGPEQGMAQVALAVSCALWGKQATVFLNTPIQVEPKPVLTRLAMSLGANVNFAKYVRGRTLKQTEDDARKYCEKDSANRFLVPFGLKDEPASLLFDTFKHALTEAIGDKAGEIAPRRMWVVAGSAFLVNILASIWPDTEFHIVQVGKTVYADQLIAIKKYVLYKSEFRFGEDTDVLPPYWTIPWYDAKLWKFVEKHGENGDYIWNVGGLPTENEINWININGRQAFQQNGDGVDIDATKMGAIVTKIQNIRVRTAKHT